MFFNRLFQRLGVKITTTRTHIATCACGNDILYHKVEPTHKLCVDCLQQLATTQADQLRHYEELCNQPAKEPRIRDLGVMLRASYLLPDPGGEVVRTCLGEITRLRNREDSETVERQPVGRNGEPITQAAANSLLAIQDKYFELMYAVSTKFPANRDMKPPCGTFGNEKRL